MEEFLSKLTEEGFDGPTRSMYFIWVDRYIVVTRDLTKKYIDKLVKGMADGFFIHKVEIYDFAAENYLLVCRFTLNLYDIVFFLPSRDGYLAGMKYFMRIKGKIDMVSLRQLYKLFKDKLSGKK